MNEVIYKKKMVFLPLLNFIYLEFYYYNYSSWQLPLLQTCHMYKYCHSILVFRQYRFLFLEFKWKYIGVRLDITHVLNLENCYKVENKHKFLDLL